MTLTQSSFDDDCEIPSIPLDWREVVTGFIICTATGIGLAYLTLAPVWVLIVISLLSLPFVLKSVKE